MGFNFLSNVGLLLILFCLTVPSTKFLQSLMNKSPGHARPTLEPLENFIIVQQTEPDLEVANCSVEFLHQVHEASLVFTIVLRSPCLPPIQSDPPGLRRGASWHANTPPLSRSNQGKPSGLWDGSVEITLMVWTQLCISIFRNYTGNNISV